MLYGPKNGPDRIPEIELTVTTPVTAVRERELPALDDDFAQLVPVVHPRRRGDPNDPRAVC